MARPVPSARALHALRAQLGIGESYTCTSCLHHTARASGAPLLRKLSTKSRPLPQASSAQPPIVPIQSDRKLQYRQRRNVTYVAPVTSVNAARSVPERNRELHTALSVLESQAAEYVNLSMLALALRGLESRDPVTRIAIQSSATRSDAKRLARVLLADPQLKGEEEWEKVLTEDDNDQRTLLIRFGETIDIDTTNPLVKVLSIPAAALEEHKLELLLIHREDVGSLIERPSQSEEETLVQTIETPISTTGRHSQVTYPVHRTIIHGKGVTGLLGAPYDEIDPEKPWDSSRRAAIDLDEDSPKQGPSNYALSLISVQQAERALSYARHTSGSLQASESDWENSHVKDICSFTYNGILPSTSLKPLHRRYISNILLTSSARLAQEQTALELMQPDPAEVTASLSPISESITVWSESAHMELRAELSNAFAGRSWRKLAWWKLPVRVDDVGMIGSDILSRFYLADAERGSIWVAGRMEQAGLTNALQILVDARKEHEENLRKIKTHELVVLKTSSNNSKDREDPDSYFHATEPWPQHIAESRHRLLTGTLPALQARAQALLVEALSGTSLSVAVGGLAYAMVSTTGLYEAGAVAAFGTAVCLSRLQRLWDRAKDAFVRDVENEGRLALEKVERECRDVVKQGEVQETTMLEGQEIRDRARGAIEEARQALDKLK